MVVQRARAAGAMRLEAKVNPVNREALPFWIAVGFHEVSAQGVVVTRRNLLSHDGRGVTSRSR